MFKKGNRDANEAYAKVKDLEQEIPKIVDKDANRILLFYIKPIFVFFVFL